MLQIKHILFVYIVIYFISKVKSQYDSLPESPCPQYFSYMNGQQLMGHIKIQSPISSKRLTIKANFSIKAGLTSSYVGRIDVMGNKLQVIKDMLLGREIHYSVHFPIIVPVPKLTALMLNGNVICTGEPERAGPGETITTISLDHVLFSSSSGSTNFQISYDTPFAESPSVSTSNSIGDLPFDDFNFDSDNNYAINTVTYTFPNRRTQTSSPYTETTKKNIQSPRTRPKPQTQRTLPPPQPMEHTPTPSFQPEILQSSVEPEPVQSSVQTETAQCGVKAGGNSNTNTLVFKGEETNKGDWPWMVAIYQRKGSGIAFVCAGSLISNENIVTAAHCIHQKTRLIDTSDIVVKIGVHNLQDWGDDNFETRSIISIDIHKLYSTVTIQNDIMIMTMSRPVQYNNFIRPICMWSGDQTQDLIVGKYGTVVGWGVSEIGSGGHGEPRQVSIPIVSTDMCRASKPDFFKLTSETTLCAGDRQGSGPCNGDSGGGLFLLVNGRWCLRGVVSLSLKSQTDNSCNLNEYVVFTDAAKYGGWISQYVKP